MKIFKLSNVIDGYASINFGELNISEIFKVGAIEILEGKNFNWDISDTDNQISDCPFYIGAFPIFRKSKLGTVLKDCGVKMATFSVEGEEYVAVSANLLEGEVIHRQQSDLRTFKSGKIMTVNKYIFNDKINYPIVFRIAEFNLFTFVDSHLKDLLLRCGFTQLNIEECETA